MVLSNSKICDSEIGHIQNMHKISKIYAQIIQKFTYLLAFMFINKHYKECIAFCKE